MAIPPLPLQVKNESAMGKEGGRKIALPSLSLRVLFYLPLTDGKVQTSQTDDGRTPGPAGGQRTVRLVDGGRLQTTWAESFLRFASMLKIYPRGPPLLNIKILE